MIQKCEKCAHAHVHDAAPKTSVAGNAADVFGGMTVAQYKAQKAATKGCGCSAAKAPTEENEGGAKVSQEGCIGCNCRRRPAAGSAGEPFNVEMQKVACACNRNRW